MLRAVLNIPWREHPTKLRLYDKIPALSHTIMESHMRFAGHSYRSKEVLVSDLLLWYPNHGTTNVGRPYKTYYQQIAEDANCNLQPATQQI